MMGAFCSIYGNTIENQVLEFILENNAIDFAVGDMAKQLEISRPKAYQAVDYFIKKGFLVKSRIIGKTQLYLINKENKVVQMLLKSFKDCLKIVAEEHGTIKVKN